MEDAENRIFEEDSDFWAEVLNRDISPGRYDDVDVSEMIRAGELRPREPPAYPQPVPRDLKVDVPLLPCSDDSGGAIHATRVLASDDLEQARALAISSDTLPGSDEPGQLVTFFQEKATAVIRCVEQERLQPLDATARVPVPVMDFSVPPPEWETRLWEPSEMFRWIRESTNVDWQGVKWTHNRAAEQRMVWAPLAHMKEKKLTAERVDVDPEILDFFVQRSRDSEIPTSGDYVYKQPGLAILQPGDDDDEEDDYIMPLDTSRKPRSDHLRDEVGRKRTATPLTPLTPLADGTSGLQGSSLFVGASTMPPPPDLTTLLSGRKRQIDETIEKRQLGTRRGVTAPAPPQISAMDVIDPALIPSTNVLRGFMSEYTDFAPLVDNFVEMNFPKKPKLTHSSFFAPPNPTPTSQSKASEDARLMPPPPKPVPALAPDITPPNLPPRVVVSSSTSKLITNQLEKVLPGIELIVRDYRKHDHPGGSTDEADIVVSPATGILLTTMVKLRQRPVPGQAGNNNAISFRRVAENVAARHERLVVLVSEGNKHSETASPLSESDARALAEFHGFAAGLRHQQHAQVRVLYVGGGVETLARWVAAVICRHAGEALPVRDLLLPVETFWEVFLRRAGLNAFAAQVVLGMLKVPDHEPAIGGDNRQLYGLPLFVMMSRERRLELFERALGGRKVLDRVSEALDEPWGQRAVGEGGFHRELEMVDWDQ